MRDIEIGGVMGHVANSTEPPSKIRYGFDLEAKKDKEPSVVDTAKGISDQKGVHGPFDMWVKTLEDGAEELWIGSLRLRKL